MSRYTINIERNKYGAVSPNTLGTDALSAIVSIPGTSDVRIEKELGEFVVISYDWTGLTDFDDTATVLAKHHCKRVEWK